MSESKRDGARKRATLDLSGFAPTPAKPAAAAVREELLEKGAYALIVEWHQSS